MTHTPGPWFVASNFEDGGVDSMYGRMRDAGNDEAECIMGGGDDYRSPDPAVALGPRVICWTQMSETADGGEAITDEDRANASLISAAPDLLRWLKVCRALIDELYADAPEDGPNFLPKIDAAIAKAEGRE